MKQRLIDTYHIWMEELKVVVKDPALILIFLIVPGFYPLLYGFLYEDEVPTEVRMIVVDESQTALSRELIRNVDAAHDVFVVGQATDMEEAKYIVLRHDAWGILHIPEDFDRLINTGQQAHVKLYAEMSSLLNYKTLMLTVSEVTLNMGADIRAAAMGAKTAKEQETTAQFVQSEWVSFYNIPNGFCGFFIPAVLILIIQQTMLLGVGTLTGTHNDRKTFCVASHCESGHNVGALTLTFGKAMSYITIYTVAVIWVLGIVPHIFKLPQLGNPWTLLAFLLPFMLSCTFFCMTLSYFSSQREFGLLMFAGTSVLFVFLSGISWPWTAMPGPLKGIAMMIPSTPGIQGFVKINTMGASLRAVWPELTILWVQAFCYWLAATRMYKWWIRHYDPLYQGRPRKNRKNDKTATA